VSGHVDSAKTRFQDLLHEQPTNPEIYVSLGTIAMRQKNRAEALNCWRRAIELNVKDADLCYRFAVLAEEAGLSEKEEKPALERAVELQPGFDNARYRLALVQYHAEDYRSTLDNLQRMAVPADPHRRYAYWTAMASSLLELNENEKAHKIALEAAKAAQTETERGTALQLASMALTDLNVQFSTDADGHSQMVTTRIPHGTKDWNPFIEPSDAIQHSNGKLSQVLCKDDKLTGFLLVTPNGAVRLDVADPTRVLMRNSPSEFYCGPTPNKPVAADYAVIKSAGQTKNILRGLYFQP
jgi:tetratricopeptide (TPR) repeat protein